MVLDTLTEPVQWLLLVHFYFQYEMCVCVSCSNQVTESTHRPLNEVPCVLCGPVLPSVVDYHALYDVGHLVFQLEIKDQYTVLLTMHT